MMRLVVVRKRYRKGLDLVNYISFLVGLGLLHDVSSHPATKYVSLWSKTCTLLSLTDPVNLCTAFD